MTNFNSARNLQPENQNNYIKPVLEPASPAPIISEQSPETEPTSGIQPTDTFVHTHHLDTSHELIRQKLYFIDHKLGGANLPLAAQEIANITFTKVSQVISSLQAYRLRNKHLGIQESPDKTPYTTFDIQSVDSDVLKEVLSSSFSLDQQIPSQSDIFYHISPRTAQDIGKIYERLKSRRLVYLSGITGVGKTTMALTLAYHLKKPVYVETGDETKRYNALTQKVQMTTIEGRREVTMIPAGVIKAAMVGGIYVVNEFNYLPGDVQLAIAQIIDEKEILLDNGIRIPVHPDFCIIASGNPNYGGTKKINDAVLRRAQGEIEITPLSLEEEREAIGQEYIARIKHEGSRRGVDLYPALSPESVNLILEKIQELRSAIRKHNQLAKSLSGKILFEDGVDYADQFSFRKLVQLLQNIDLSGEKNLESALSRVVVMPPESSLKSYQVLLQKLGLNFLNFEFVAPPKKKEEKELTLMEKFKMALEKEHRSGNIIEDLSLEADKEKEKHAPRKKTLTTPGKRYELPPIEYCDAPEIVDSEWEFDENPEKESGEIIRTNQGIHERAKTSFDRVLGVASIGTGKNKKIVPVKKTLKESQSVIKAFKNILTFEYKPTERAPDQTIKGYVLLGYRGLIRDASFFDVKNKKYYLLNKDRIGSHCQVYLPDSRGNILIQPETGEICTINHYLSQDGDIDQAFLPRAEGGKGFVLCRAVLTTNSSQEELSIKSSVTERIRNSMIHASEAKSKLTNSNKDHLTTIAQEMVGSFEGTPFFTALTPEKAGRYLKYPTASMKLLLEQLSIANLKSDDVLLTGPSGTGKTSLAKTYAINTNRPYISIQMHAEAKESGLLKNIRLKNGEFADVPLPLLLAYKYGYVAEIKEINLGFAPYLAFMNTLLDRNGSFELDGEIISRHPDFILIMTRNPYSSLYEGTNPMISSTVNRPATCLEITYPTVHEEAEALYDCALGENPELIADLPEKKARAFFLSLFALSFVSNIREALTDKNTKPEVKELLQKRKWTTDIFMDSIASAKSRQEFIKKFIFSMSFTDEEYTKIPPSIVSKTAFQTLLAELSKYQ